MAPFWKGTSGKSRLNLGGTILKGNKWQIKAKHTCHHFERENQSILDPEKMELKGRERELMIWRTKMQAKVQTKPGFNSRIQFASNESKLVLRNLDLGKSHVKWALIRASLTLKTPTLLSFFDLGSRAL